MSFLVKVITVVFVLIGFSWLAWAYPAAKLGVLPGDIVFSHQVHAEQDCTDCHDEIEQSESASDRNFPTMDPCGACHDVEDDQECGMCHRNIEEPGDVPHPDRPVLFNHKGHLERSASCDICHDTIVQSTQPSDVFMPKMIVCLDCHDGANADDDCGLCHGNRLTLLDIHPMEWKHQHDERAVHDRSWCNQCHRQEAFCMDCHRGDNLTGNIHELNYVYTHGLDANSKELDCSRCHDRKQFCNDCHQSENRISMLHSTLGWLAEHGRTARNDIENCAACHDTDDPTCGRGGCHRDADGIRGTDPRIHPGGISRFDDKGPWHGDNGYFCYQCHVNTSVSGTGFCGYCHN